MRFLVTVLLSGSLFLLLPVGCARQDGTVTGTITPPTAGVRISALQDGKTVSVTDAGLRDGTFRMMLAPGNYDISVSVPSSPFPMTFQSVVIQSGKTTDLARIEVPLQSAAAVLSGRIVPGGAGTKVALYADGRERAAIHADGEGKYQFTELPAGAYTLQVSAPDYAPDAVAVDLAHEKAATQNVRLLYVSAIDGVDWAAGRIRVTGVGLPPANTANPTIRREMARRAALADAQRKLVKAVAEIKVDPGRNLRSFWGDKSFRDRVQGFVQGYKVVGERELESGKIELDLELPLTGQGGLSRYLAE